MNNMNQKILDVNIEDEVKKSFIDYAMSVIVSRALPDVRDGLKPVHRRILYAMYELGITPDKPYRKSARIVGDVLGKYHPHGEGAVYDAMVRMAQDFSTRYPLVDGHGNFGSVDGDSAAAMRYTEARLSRIAMELMADINKETVDFTPNFDETLKEPTVLPSKFPNLLVNGSSGIAVGMATNIPPHNLGEVIDGTVALIDNPYISLKHLMEHIKGPDFPTGGIILGKDGIRQAYGTGKGRIIVRAKAEIEETSNNRFQIVVTEIPYQVNKAKLIERIAELVRGKRIDGITEIRDESDRSGMRIVIELKRDVNPNVVLNSLYKHTQMQDTFGVILLALVDGEPKIMNLKEMLIHYIEHQKEVIIRRSRYDLDRALARAHILEGLLIALDHIDAVITLIRRSRTVQAAREGLVKSFSLTEKQAQAILDMRLQRLTGLEREKIQQEYAEIQEIIKYLNEILSNEHMVYSVIKKELLEIKEKYSDERKTQISSTVDKIDVEDLIQEHNVVITLTHFGYVKRTPLSTYKSQRRGGKGIMALQTRENDFVEDIYITSTHNRLLFFTSLGKVYELKAYEIPEAGRQARGMAIINLLQLAPGERIQAVIPVRDTDQERYLIMSTRNGYVKKSSLDDFSNIRKNGLIAINLRDGDELIQVQMTDGNRDIIMASRLGMSIRFNESDVRTMGRNAMGVKGMELKDGDYIVGMGLVEEGASVLCISENGYGKKTPVDEYRPQTRGGKGIITMKITEKTGNLVALKMVTDEDDLMIINSEGTVIRLDTREIATMGRNTQGVMLMKLDDGAIVTSIAKVRRNQENAVDEV
ncbi:MAG: DNA gyrase subunit A [Clostridiales bacterium]|jgi:DNA gyrase subunit A|nr:DNA gyrase subunit A [Clostridiales bacterium]